MTGGILGCATLLEDAHSLEQLVDLPAQGVNDPQHRCDDLSEAGNLLPRGFGHALHPFQRPDIDDVFLMLEGQDVLHPVDAVHDVGTRFYQVRTLCGHDVL